jgi:starch synthase (maltosyl-transferring)
MQSIEAHARRRVLVQSVAPTVDGGRYDAKRCLGDRVTVGVDLVSDGHDIVAGVLHVRAPGASANEVQTLPLVAKGNDRFEGTFLASELGRWQFSVTGFIDRFATWHHGLVKKAQVGQATELDLASGAELLAAAAKRAATPGADPVLRADLEQQAKLLSDKTIPLATRITQAADTELAFRVARVPDLSHASPSETFGVQVEPLRARFGAWYELFPRSTDPSGKHGTFKTTEARLPYVAGLGFDVLYLPPIHPIGLAFRKGPNNSLEARPEDPGSPWAIGAKEGGHKAVHPQLGTLDDFRHLVEAARALHLQIALDIAFQVSPDHPYVKEHPEWFIHRPDGSIQYAENPPKKYQDVYPFDFECAGWEALWNELLSVFLFWVEQGVTIFRVDNPHTKSLNFWEWCLGAIKKAHPEVIFLAEAFTRPKVMYTLAKAGFSQSYTYFTWRTTKRELEEFITECNREPVRDFYRPNLWPNTPDILPEHLQFGGRPVVLQRLILAATLAGSYGMYGPAFELGEHVARAGTEEYVDNEKYQLRQWNLDDPESVAPVIRRINRIRRENPAFASDQPVVFHPTDHEHLICYSRRMPREALAEAVLDHASPNRVANGDPIVVVMNLDPHYRHGGWVNLDLAALGIEPGERYQVHDLLSDARYSWEGSRNYVELDPALMPAHVFRIRRRVRSENDFEYFL